MAADRRARKSFGEQDMPKSGVCSGEQRKGSGRDGGWAGLVCRKAKKDSGQKKTLKEAQAQEDSITEQKRLQFEDGAQCALGSGTSW